MTLSDKHDSDNIGSTERIGGRGIKRKKSNRLLTILLVCAIAYVLGMFFIFDHADVGNPLDAYEKTSIDNTPNFNITEPHTRCQYVYDSVNKTITQAKGSEGCALPSFN